MQAYGIVWKAVNKKTKETVALKKIFDAFRNQTDAQVWWKYDIYLRYVICIPILIYFCLLHTFQRTFREISFLQDFGEHPNIISLYNVIRANSDKDIYLVFEYMGMLISVQMKRTRMEPTNSDISTQNIILSLVIYIIQTR